MKLKLNQKILFIVIIFVIITLLIVKIFANATKQDYNNLSNVNNELTIVNQSEVENFIKVWEFLYTFKENKQVAYELRRKLEKQDPFTILNNKENFINITKSLKYTESQKERIKELFADDNQFHESFYLFYFYLIMSQLDEQKISELKKQSKFIISKIYKVDPDLIQKIRSKNDSDLNQILQEIEKNIYNPNLSENKRRILINELNKINTIINTYNSIKDTENFKWIVNKRENILKSLAL